MDRVVIRGIGATAFTRKSGRMARDLAREAIDAAMADAGVASVDGVWFGSATGGQRQPATVLGPSTLGVEGVAIHQVEAACATGGMAVYGACAALRSGLVRTALVVGVDTADVPDLTALLDGAIAPDPTDGAAWAARAAAEAGVAWAPSPTLPVQLEISALGARARPVAAEALAAVAVKARAAGAANPLAGLRRPTSLAEVLAEPPVVPPFSRSMLCGLVDGAAALVLSADGDGVTLAGLAAGGGRRAPLDAPPPIGAVARRALAMAGVDRPDLAEVHDATAWAELAHLDAMGLFPRGAVRATLDGVTATDGALPVNPSGGLLSRGHALAATGVVQVVEVVRRLRARPGTGLCTNGGGLVGVQDAFCVASVWRG